MREELLEENDRAKYQQRHHQRHQGRLRHMPQDGQQVSEESGLLDVDAEQLRDLIDHDDQADTRLEPGQDGLGDEVRDEAEAQH